MHVHTREPPSSNGRASRLLSASEHRALEPTVERDSPRPPTSPLHCRRVEGGVPWLVVPHSPPPPRSDAGGNTAPNGSSPTVPSPTRSSPPPRSSAARSVIIAAPRSAGSSTSSCAGRVSRIRRSRASSMRVGRRRVVRPDRPGRGDRDRPRHAASARLDLRDFERRDGEVVLNGDVVDHQLVDVDGVRVVRASDLYLARVAGVYRLVGVDVGFQTLLRRLGPTRWRHAADARACHRLGRDPAVRGRRARRRRRDRCGCTRRTRRCGGCGRRSSPTCSRSSGATSARSCWRSSTARPRPTRSRRWSPRSSARCCASPSTDRAAELLAEMEPDEAADALPRPGSPTRPTSCSRPCRPSARSRLRALLLYREGSAGGLMTTNLVLVRPEQTVGEVRRILRAEAEHQADVDAVIIIDDDGSGPARPRAVRAARRVERRLGDRRRRPAGAGDGRLPTRRSTTSSSSSWTPAARRCSSWTTTDARSAASSATTWSTRSVPERGRVRFPRLFG